MPCLNIPGSAGAARSLRKVCVRICSNLWPEAVPGADACMIHPHCNALESSNL